MHGEKQELCPRPHLFDVPGSLDPIQQGQGNVENDQIRFQAQGCIHKRPAVSYLFHDVVAPIEQTPNTGQDERMVVCQQDRTSLDQVASNGTATVTSVPSPGCDRMLRFPPSMATRSCILSRPSPPSMPGDPVLKPMPKSFTRRRMTSAVPSKVTETRSAEAWRATLLRLFFPPLYTQQPISPLSSLRKS